mgnify:CR=1 FL=1
MSSFNNFLAHTKKHKSVVALRKAQQSSTREHSKGRDSKRVSPPITVVRKSPKGLAVKQDYVKMSSNIQLIPPAVGDRVELTKKFMRLEIGDEKEISVLQSPKADFPTVKNDMPNTGKGFFGDNDKKKFEALSLLSTRRTTLSSFIAPQGKSIIRKPTPHGSNSNTKKIRFEESTVSQSNQLQEKSVPVKSLNLTEILEEAPPLTSDRVTLPQPLVSRTIEEKSDSNRPSSLLFTSRQNPRKKYHKATKSLPRHLQLPLPLQSEQPTPNPVVPLTATAAQPEQPRAEKTPPRQNPLHSNSSLEVANGL